MEKKPIPYSAIWAVLVIALIVFGYTLLASEKPKSLPDKVIVRDPNANVTVTGPTGPIDVTIIGISDTRCPTCKDDVAVIQGIVDSAGSMNFNVLGVLELNQTDPRAQALIEKYNITRLPTVLVNKEAAQSELFLKTWTELLGTQEVDGTFVMRDRSAPFVENDTVVGAVNITVLTDNACAQCVKTDLFLNTLRFDADYQVYYDVIKTVDVASEEGQALVAQYGILKTPSFILSEEAGWYPHTLQLFEIVTQEQDGQFVYRNTYPPYRMVETGETKGLVDMIQVVDASCTDCYNPGTIRETLEYYENGYFMVFDEVRVVDINSPEGQELNEKYRFEFVPTAILSPEAGEYAPFAKNIGDFGTQESDGWYIFRNKQALGNSTVRMQ